METEEGPSSQCPSHTHIIIVGAGIAGLTAGYHLIKNGVADFKILEARKRLGGRLIQIPIGQERVELGANWIHGVLGNPVYELAMLHNLVDILQVPKPHRVVATTEDGKQVPFKVLHEIHEAYQCFLRRCEEYFISQYLPPDGIESVGEHIRLEIDLYLENIPDERDRHLRELIFDCLLKRETCISGCDSMSEIDLLEIGSYTELQGGNIVLPNGYSSILEPLTKDLPPESVLREHPVTKIRWSRTRKTDEMVSDSDSDNTVIEQHTFTSQMQKGAHSVEVVCANGQLFHADHVICTIPLGVLKSCAQTLFEPPLPDYKLEAIDRLLFGTVDKILLEYDRPLLNPNITEVMLLWDDRNAQQTMTKDMSEMWYRKIYSFTKISDTLLLGWISGKEAEYMETLPNEIVMETCTRILRRFLNDAHIPAPKSCVCTSWASQPYTKGSYTAIAVGASQTDIEYLAQPLYRKEADDKPVVLFAGEHTHINFYSTVHGAFLTGRSAARTLISDDTREEIVLDCEEISDLSSWIQGISLQ